MKLRVIIKTEMSQNEINQFTKLILLGIPLLLSLLRNYPLKSLQRMHIINANKKMYSHKRSAYRQLQIVLSAIFLSKPEILDP